MESMKKTSVKRSHPLVPVTEIWERNSISRYPETIRIPFDNGLVVNYKIDQPKQPHPCFLKAIDLIKSMKEGGYQYEEKKPVTVTAVPAGDESNGAKRITNNTVILSQKGEKKQWLKRIKAFLKR